MNQTNSNRIKLLVRVSMLGALSFVLMLIEFYIGFAEFLKLDLSDIVAMIAGITMGPLAAVGVQFVKNLLKVAIASKTLGIGELANLIVGIAYVLPATIIYHRMKNNKGLIIGLVSGAITMVVVACLANFFILLPAYWTFLSSEPMTGLAKWGYIQLVILPFNLIKGLVVSGLTYGVHRALKPFYKHIVMDFRAMKA